MQKIEQKKGKEKAKDHRNRSNNRRYPPKLGNIEIIRVLVKIGAFEVQVPARPRSTDAVFEYAAKLGNHRWVRTMSRGWIGQVQEDDDVQKQT